ncbi:MAG: phytase [Candidatus Andeanibacterium colombiense]|uniref:Phytase n=1 Tax=Candidatus Andeanibacterium colombiense TaxID=3121345 RepID=A0AAJ5X5M1_9SPHN|nr:MAG: phytase [Sphingomonadaceae bacterium]
MRAALTLTALGLALAACSNSKPPAEAAPAVFEVTASGETVPVGTGNADAADDPAIWLDAENPANSLIVATDKKAGLYVYGLDGKIRDFSKEGRLNNVALADMGADGIIVAASDRNDEAAAKIMLYRLDTKAAKLIPLGTVDGGKGEGYGICVAAQADGLHVYSVLKAGDIGEYRVTFGPQPKGELVRGMKLNTQTEGCVADPRDGSLYVGEEDVGIWRFAAGSTKGELVAKADGKQLVADVEGLALAAEGKDGGWLIASSQGDNSYSVYRLPGMAYAGRFRIAKGAFGATEETDGIDLVLGDFGPNYPTGLFVAQDGENGDKAQNFKLVSWEEIEKGL